MLCNHYLLPYYLTKPEPKKISFIFDGKKYSGYQGDTLASALIRNNVYFVGRSFKYHRPRGIISAGSEEPNAIVQLEFEDYNIFTSTIPVNSVFQQSNIINKLVSTSRTWRVLPSSC